MKNRDIISKTEIFSGTCDGTNL